MGGKIVSFVLLILVIGCSKKKGYEQIAIIGHAATGLEIVNSVYHDNSKEAVEFALSIDGCDGVEIDIQLSQDGNLWLYHDEQLQSQTNASGCIFEKQTDQLNEVNYSTVAKEKLVSLDELDFSRFQGKELFLDFRHYSFCSESFVSVNQVLAKLMALQINNPENFKLNCILSNENWITPFLNAGFSVCFSIFSMSEYQHIQENYTITSYIVKNDDFSKEQVETIKRVGKKVYIFEMRSPKGIRKALNKMPDGVLTDDIRATLIEKY